MSPDHTILLVEGKKAPAEHLTPILEEEYEITTARTRREALAKVQELPPAVIVLDAPSLRFSCRRFCSALQDAALDIPVLLLFAEGEKADHDVGARAYLQYPFSAPKLITRISWLLPAPDDQVLRVGGLIFNIKRRVVTRGDRGSQCHLTPLQAHLLEIFMRHPGEVLSRDFLMKQVWNTDFTEDTRTLDVHIHLVRKAIEENTKSPVYLRTIRGAGYRFEAPKEMSERSEG